MTVQMNEKVVTVSTVSEVSDSLPVDSIKPKSFWHIDKEMVRFKLHYFLFIGGVGTSMPYVSLFSRDKVGLASSSLGAILTTQMFLFIFSKPIIGYIADYSKKLKLILSLLTVVYTSCYFLLLLVPTVDTEEEHDKLVFCPLNSSLLCEAFGDVVTGEVRLLDDNILQNVTIPCQRITLNYSVTIPCYQSFKNYDIAMNLTNGFITQFCSLHGVSSDLSNSVEIVFGHRPIIPLENVTAVCAIQSSNLIDGSRISQESVSDFVTYKFWLFAIIYSLSSISANAIFTLSDTALCETVAKTGTEFGRQRLWGGIGWGLMAPIGGYLNDYTGDFLASWILMAAMMIVFLWNVSYLDLVKPHFSRNILKDVGLVLKSREFLTHEMLIWVNGMGASLIWFYLALFLTSIGGSTLLCGLSLFVQSFFGSMPCMFFADWIKKKFGHFNVLLLAMSGYVVRFLWYSQLKNPWYVLPVEILHGITYGIYYPVLASFAKTSAKPGTEATTQALVFSTHEGLGGGIGCVIAGIGFDYLGGNRTFFFAGIFALTGVVGSIVLSLLVRNQTGKVKVTTKSKP